ncbi:UNVERIFIED_CONTAM: hypothetical protein FKN15_047840 [Acipenser sinensis]
MGINTGNISSPYTTSIDVMVQFYNNLMGQDGNEIWERSMVTTGNTQECKQLQQLQVPLRKIHFTRGSYFALWEQRGDTGFRHTMSQIAAGIDTHIVYLRLSPRSTLLYQKQCEIVYLTCMTPGPAWTTYRIMVEILNENDNRPEFLPHSIQPLNISEKHNKLTCKVPFCKENGISHSF